jgi:hypothetical protein
MPSFHHHHHDHDQHGHHHDHPHHGHSHELDRRSLLRAGGLGLGAMLLAACRATPTAGAGSQQTAPTPPSTAPSTSSSAATVQTTLPSTTAAKTASTIATLAGFDAFASTVNVIADGEYWLVESNGMPAHNMMVGITSWQQQVGVPQPYTGANAWKIPVNPVLAESPISAKTSLYRGATTRFSSANSTTGVDTQAEPTTTTITSPRCIFRPQ